MNALRLDLRWSLRTLARRPAGSVAVVAILACAIAAATVLGSFFAAVVSQTPPVESPDALVHVWRADNTRPAGHREPSAGDFLAWKDEEHTIAALTASAGLEVVVGAPDGRNVAALRVTSEYFRLAGRQTQLGRPFAAADFDRAAAVIISDALWRERFHGHTNVIGHLLPVDAAPREIVGVMPPGFWMPTPGIHVWLPYRPGALAEIVDIEGRLAPGVTAAGAQVEFDLLARRAAVAAASRDTRTLVRTFAEESRVRMGPLLRGLVAPALALLLIACANIANLLIIGMTARDREFAIRAALGATPAMLARASIVESAILACSGGAAGLVLSAWGVALLQAGVAASLPSLAGAVHIARFVPGAAAIATMLTVLGIGVLPAWSVARRDPLPSLSGAARAPISSRFQYGVGDVLVVLQVGLAVVFVVSTAMLVRVFVEIGRQLRPVVHGDVYVSRLVTRGEIDRRHQFTVYADIVDSVARSVGLEYAALASDVPAVAGRPTLIVAASTAGTNECRVGMAFVSRTYFETLGVRLERGGVPASGAAALVSASAARKCWSAASTQEWRLRVNSAAIDGWLPVAGVAPDLYAGPPRGNAGLRVGDPALVWIVGAPEWPGRVYLLVRPRAALSGVTIANAVGRASSAVAMEPLARLDAVADGLARQSSFLVGILAVVGAMALVLAFVSVYAALTQSCSSRLRELGVRLALGASPPRLVMIVVARDLPLVAIGVIAGVIGTLWVTAAVWRDLLLISAADPRLWMAVCGLLGCAGVLASIGPALRAIRVDPIAVLRAD